jgi:hypothetical protein
MTELEELELVLLAIGRELGAEYRIRHREQPPRSGQPCHREEEEEEEKRRAVHVPSPGAELVAELAGAAVDVAELVPVNVPTVSDMPMAKAPDRNPVRIACAAVELVRAPAVAAVAPRTTTIPTSTARAGPKRSTIAGDHPAARLAISSTIATATAAPLTD